MQTVSTCTMWRFQCRSTYILSMVYLHERIMLQLSFLLYPITFIDWLCVRKLLLSTWRLKGLPSLVFILYHLLIYLTFYQKEINRLK